MSSVTSWAHITDDMAESYSRPPVQQSGEVNTRVIGGTLSMVNGQSGTTESSTVRLNESDLVSQRGALLGTVRNNGGFPTQNITPDCTVEIPGFGRTSVKVAESLGYLSRNAEGRYAEMDPLDNTEQGAQNGNEQGAQNGNEQGQNGAGVDLFNPNMEAAYGDLIADVPQGTYDALLGSSAALLAEGQNSEGIAAALAPRLAAAMGVEPSRAEGMIKSGARVWQQQADATVKAAGADPDDFWQWASANRKDALQQATIQQLCGRNTNGYKALLSEYFDNTYPTEDALKRGGIPTKKDGDTVMVKLKGHWMSLDSAVKARLV